MTQLAQSTPGTVDHTAEIARLNDAARAGSLATSRTVFTRALADILAGGAEDPGARQASLMLGQAALRRLINETPIEATSTYATSTDKKSTYATSTDKKSTDKKSTYDRIYAVVRQIPPGQVASYGQIATLAGLPGRARLVGYALFRVTLPSADIPWHRVINAKGEVSHAPQRRGTDYIQAQMLADEGIEFDPKGRISWQRYGWQPEQRRGG